MGRAMKWIFWGVFLLTVVFILVPIGGTFLFSLGNRWDRTVFPEGYTLEAYKQIFSDREFWFSMGRSFLLAVAVIGISVVLVVQTLLAVQFAVPRARWLVEVSFLIPFVIPAVLFALGFVEVFAPLPFPLYGTPTLLLFANVVLSFPLMYRAISNRMYAIGMPRMIESALTLGARWPLTIFRVVLPNLLPGITSGGLLVLSLVISEFALANLIVGGSWPTFSVYLYSVTRVDGRMASALSVVSFFYTWFFATLVLKGGNRYVLP